MSPPVTSQSTVVRPSSWTITGQGPPIPFPAGGAEEPGADAGDRLDGLAAEGEFLEEGFTVELGDVAVRPEWLATVCPFETRSSSMPGN